MSHITPSSQSALGPGYYDSKLIPSKKNFNYGKVVFGSKANKKRISRASFISGIPSFQTPGPGYYDL